MIRAEYKGDDSFELSLIVEVEDKTGRFQFLIDNCDDYINIITLSKKML